MGWKPRDMTTIDTLDEWKPFLLARERGTFAWCDDDR